MTKTENYNLPQWDKNDRVLMEDFNAAMNQIEKGLSAKCEMYYGTYTGTGTYGQANPTVLHMGFTPKLVIVMGSATASGEHIVLLNPYDVGKSYGGDSGAVYLTWLEDGVQWYSPFRESTQFNRPNEIYHYLAFR